MENRDILNAEAQLKVDMDRKIIDYLDTHIETRVAIEYEIRKRELHEAIVGAIEKAVKEDAIQVNTVEDFLTLVELDLLLLQ